MKVKVSELTGRQLNYAVAVCLWGEPEHGPDCWREWKVQREENGAPFSVEISGRFSVEEFNPQGNWAHGGELIEKYATQLSAPSTFDDEGCIAATYVPKKGQGLKSGDTFLIAFCRSLVSAIHRQDEIEIPDELCEVAV